MQTEDLDTPIPVNKGGGEGDNTVGLSDSNSEPCGADLKHENLEEPKSILEVKVSKTFDADAVKLGDEVLPPAVLEKDLLESSHVMEVCVEVKELQSVSQDVNSLNTNMQIENGCITERSSIAGQKREGSPVSNSLSGSKKPKIMIDEQPPSVRVMFNSLTSKQKLEELLQHWSEWHAKHRSLSHDSTEVLESGEQTYFPALRIGPSNSSAVSVWMDNHIGRQQNMEIAPLDSKAIPLYDRGYSWALTLTDVSNNQEGGLERMDSSLCSNCGAYDHALRDCSKPRDNAAVNNARKEHNSKRNLNANSRNPTRYYQNSSGGKYDGLKLGSLDAETRKLLGLGELDPPPWLNRMREIGYPPGYLDPDDEDQPSGILIYGDEEFKEESEDGEILDTDFVVQPREMSSEPPRKMSVLFPGINAPIPENASEIRWSDNPLGSDFYSNQSYQRANHLSERNMHQDQRWSRDIKYSHSNSRYNDLDSGYSYPRERGIFASPIDPTSERSFSDRGRWSPSGHDDSPSYGSYNSRRSSPSNRPFSSQTYGSGSSRRWDDDRRNDFDSNYSSRHRDRDDNHHSSRRR